MALDLAAQPVAVIAFVAMQDDCLGRHRRQQGFSGDAIRDMTARQDEADWATKFAGNLLTGSQNNITILLWNKMVI